MQVKIINIVDIEVTDRLRPVTAEAVKGLAEDIAQRGLRQPIEVVAQTRGSKYRLVAGAHRLAACKLAGMDQISAVVVSGNKLELRRAEILENLARNELSKLERAQFLAELKRLFQEANPDAKHGGDRTKEQVARMANWSVAVAMRSQSSIRTVERYSLIGESLNAEAAETLRGTDFEDSLKELEALARLEQDIQIAVADHLVDDGTTPKTVAQAVKIIGGHAAPEDVAPEIKQLSKLMDTWNRNDNPKARADFLNHLAINGLITAAVIARVK